MPQLELELNGIFFRVPVEGPWEISYDIPR